MLTVTERAAPVVGAVYNTFAGTVVVSSRNEPSATGIAATDNCGLSSATVAISISVGLPMLASNGPAPMVMTGGGSIGAITVTTTFPELELTRPPSLRVKLNSTSPNVLPAVKFIEPSIVTIEVELSLSTPAMVGGVTLATLSGLFSASLPNCEASRFTVSPAVTVNVTFVNAVGAVFATSATVTLTVAGLVEISKPSKAK